MKNTILPSVVAIAALALVSVGAATDADANLCGGTGTACTPTSLFVFNSVPNSQSFSDGSSQAQITKGSFIDTFDFELSPPPVTYNTVTDTVSSGFGSDAGM